MTSISTQRTVDAPASVVWEVVTDHDLYAEVAPNLSTVDVLGGDGAEMVRRCVDVDGNEWTESCTRWEDGSAFAVSVDVANSDFHRRLFARFEGEWRVTERPDGSRITITFEFDPRYGPLGRVISWYFERRAPSIVTPILDGWEAAIQSRLGKPAGSGRAPDDVGSGDAGRDVSEDGTDHRETQGSPTGSDTAHARD